MPSFLKPAAVSKLEKLRIDGWLTAWAASDPQVSVAFVRTDDDGVETTLPAQDVVAVWANLQPPSQLASPEGAIEPTAGVQLKRPLALGFDVAVGDAGRIGGARVRVAKTWDAGGMRWADCLVDVG